MISTIHFLLATITIGLIESKPSSSVKTTEDIDVCYHTVVFNQAFWLNEGDERGRAIFKMTYGRGVVKEAFEDLVNFYNKEESTYYFDGEECTQFKPLLVPRLGYVKNKTPVHMFKSYKSLDECNRVCEPQIKIMKNINITDFDKIIETPDVCLRSIEDWSYRRECLMRVTDKEYLLKGFIFNGIECIQASTCYYDKHLYKTKDIYM
jgi:hypothetical protein